MYLYTIIGAGGFGLGILLFPDLIAAALGLPEQDPITYGVTGSVYLAFAILSVFGLKAPLKFVPVLMMQLCYKSIWFVGVIVPMVVSGRFPGYAILPAVIFASYIIGDLIAIPFKYVFSGAEYTETVTIDS
jgi:hypothetical protein